jgi:uncharacterized Zn finger protein
VYFEISEMTVSGGPHLRITSSVVCRSCGNDRNFRDVKFTPERVTAWCLECGAYVTSTGADR